MRSSRAIFWIPALSILATVTVAFLARQPDAASQEAGPLSTAACQTIDGIFRPKGIAGKEQLLKHLINASDRLAMQTGGQLRRASQIHASYARLLHAETTGNNPAITEQTHIEGLAAYDTIRANGWKYCALQYLKPAAKG